MRVYTGAAVSFFLVLGLAVATHAQEQRQPTTLEQCQAILSAYGELQISAKQAEIAAKIQTGMAQVCSRLIDAEKPKQEPKKTEGK